MKNTLLVKWLQIILRCGGKMLWPIGIRALDLRKDEVMLLSFQMTDNTTGYREGPSKKGKKRTRANTNHPGEPPVTGATRLLISNRALEANWRHWPLKGEQWPKDRDSLWPRCLVLSYVIYGNHHIWRRITKKVDGKQQRLVTIAWASMLNNNHQK